MPALPLAIILLLVIPLVEIYLLIEVGQVIGALATVALCVLTAIAGGVLLRFQGLATLRRAQMSAARGAPPALELLEGIALAIGGALLLTPGFATDLIGFLCLIPWSRRPLARLLLARAQTIPVRTGGPRHPPFGDGGRTIEGEFRRDEDDSGPSPPQR